MNVLIFLQSGKIPFFSLLAELLEKKKFKISFSVNNKVTYRNLKFFLEKRKKNFQIDIQEKKIFSNLDILKLSKYYERKYRFNFSFLMSIERGIGRSYLSNVDNYPSIVRSNWNYEKKLLYILKEFIYFENLIIKKKPKLILSLTPNYIINLLSKYYSIKYYSLAYAKLGERFLWGDNCYPDNKFLIKSIKSNRIPKNKNFLNINKIIKKNSSTYAHSLYKYSYFQNLKNLIVYVFLEFYRKIRKTNKKNSYYFLSHSSRIIKRPFIFNKVKKIGLDFEILRDKNYIYMPLHLEPEMALQNFSPEFNNQLEMIYWISKSLPSNYFIAVKEHPEMYGLRTIKYINNLIKIPNVLLVKPEISSLKLINKCKAVATITGTAAFEAVYLKKPVLSFGKHQVINSLSSVFYCSNFIQTEKNIKKILNGIDNKILKINSNKLLSSIYQNSFELIDLDKIDDAFDGVKRSLKKKYSDIKKWENLAQIAFNNLLSMLKKKTN